MRLFFMADGSAVPFFSKDQLGAGAGTATSPEVLTCQLGRGQQGVGMWKLMKGCDTWAAGRAVYELLLQCVRRKDSTGLRAGLGLPPLNTTPYKQEDLPPLPGYSAGLQRTLQGMMAHDPAQRLTPRQALVRCQVLLWGSDAGVAGAAGKPVPGLTSACSSDEAGVWLQWQQSRLCTAVAECAVLPGTGQVSGAGGGGGAGGGAGAGAGAGGAATADATGGGGGGGMDDALARLAGGGAGIVHERVAGSLWAAFVGNSKASEVVEACHEVLSS